MNLKYIFRASKKMYTQLMKDIYGYTHRERKTLKHVF
jgi:hypothetical protein